VLYAQVTATALSDTELKAWSAGHGEDRVRAGSYLDVAVRVERTH
jgi:hypothetical protein